MDKKVREYLTTIARRGGTASMAKRTKAERTDLARKAVQARWAKSRAAGEARLTELAKRIGALRQAIQAGDPRARERD